MRSRSATPPRFLRFQGLNQRVLFCSFEGRQAEPIAIRSTLKYEFGLRCSAAQFSPTFPEDHVAVRASAVARARARAVLRERNCERSMAARPILIERYARSPVLPRRPSSARVRVNARKGYLNAVVLIRGASRTRFGPKQTPPMPIYRGRMIVAGQFRVGCQKGEERPC